MGKPISTKAHGFIDYMTAGLLVTLPRAMGWSKSVTTLLDSAAAGTVAYSLMTRYELGLVKALPMKAHLAIDALQAGGMLAAAALLDDEEPDVRATLAALGVFELGVTLLSRTQPDGARVNEANEVNADASMPQAPYRREQSESGAVVGRDKMPVAM